MPAISCARPALVDREAVGVQVVGDQGGAGPFHVRRVGPVGHLLQLGGQLLLGRRLALLPFAVLVPDRPPAAGLLAGRVDGNAALQLNDLATAAGRRPAGPAGVDPAGRNPPGPCPASRGSVSPRAGCGNSVGILKFAALLTLCPASFCVHHPHSRAGPPDGGARDPDRERRHWPCASAVRDRAPRHSKPEAHNCARLARKAARRRYRIPQTEN